jgi:hypothetical protein
VSAIKRDVPRGGSLHRKGREKQESKMDMKPKSQVRYLISMEQILPEQLYILQGMSTKIYSFCDNQ